MKKFLKYQLDAMQTRVIKICVICFTILKKHYHPSNSKSLTKFSSLVMQTTLPKSFTFQFYQICTFENVRRCKLPLEMQTEISLYFVGNKSLALELRPVSQFILKRLGYNIVVYSKCSINSVIVGTFSGHLVLPHY